ncbi:formate dehydrogenase accessory sulfurtransferase FdhD [Undibacterium oligocarboniphilum]|uniref:Sulfur carrier protein FdhD n=1 Tax=Undibacterium oligocarboniphilum TaxID=666702 RepID=A0A850QJD8_9BURK|nr:formate dehydrogenase accessory sulfurtransferase FdhD [Undibacterium oligocarboniphilum]MBC3871061.1 formate dehydrogenase accessory sulfurtransferase FdhD [Undibacterium oligocarboniphilum]NVO76316.1 formate dehydrogenase accessory sulfurtransferase FdhD [Undibacterium oligocarboniphilum]
MNAAHPILTPQGVRRTTVYEWEDAREHGIRTSSAQECFTRHDWVAEEVPVALVINGITFAVMMASPVDLADFALGFALTEGIIEQASDLYSVEVEPAPFESGQSGQGGIVLHLDIASERAWRLKERRRNLAGRTGCGLCGAESLNQVQRALPQAPTVLINPEALLHAQQVLRESQTTQQLTGASHAAAWCNAQGEILLCREDVGRHNALDKLIGAQRYLIKKQNDATFHLASDFILITSRASFEMVQKTLLAGVGALAAVSAPTDLAVNTARQHNLALAGFVRQHRLVSYSFPERFGFLHPQLD